MSDSQLQAEVAAAAAAWRPWVERQYAELQPIAGNLTSFTAVSWDHLGPSAGPLRLADFLRLLSWERLREVTLVLSDGEPLPVDALAVLEGCPQLRSLTIQSLHDNFWVSGTLGEFERQEEAGAAALRRLCQLTSLSIERPEMSEPVVEALLQLSQLEQLAVAVTDPYAFADLSVLGGRFPNLRHLRLSPPLWSSYGLQVALPRPAAFRCLESFEFGLHPNNKAGHLWFQSQGYFGTKCGVWVRFSHGQLRLQDAFTSIDDVGITSLQEVVDALLPPGQQLRVLALESLCGGEYEMLDCACRQLAATTRLELRACNLDYEALLRQAPSLQKLTIMHEAGSFGGTFGTLPAAVLPTALTRLDVEGLKLVGLQWFPAMPALEELSLSCDTLCSLVQLQPKSLILLLALAAAAVVLARMPAGDPAASGLHPKGHKLSSTLTGRDLLQSDKGKQAQQAATARQAGKATQKGGKKGDTSTPPTDSNSDDSSSNPMGPITPTSYALNCGSCTARCPNQSTCQSGSCVCNPGYTKCGTACYNLQNDALRCGAWDRRCPNRSTCKSGNCECNTGLTMCNGACADRSTDPYNCGTCGTVCRTPTYGCSYGQCVCAQGGSYKACSVNGFLTCVNTSTDPKNCGTCGHDCTLGVESKCSYGQCICPNAYEHKCGGLCVNLSTDPSNCGGCSIACSSGVCSYGQCKV
ncbi:Tryptophan synthase alpha chain isoform B [Chlorella sorokiniana]|uniref:Tryptophan synthase alpha chain isoform B n=1 Tax=Chlorella sorokiniana TaxID=3076 RepID=A0A2P6U268_CHLSO|nr:Tryptophan synthase alpha chain isoform B [Chlorella sorokiniana]|eukprot:PRW60407.1 Tryptophan synthase alpha chain isoform B [Chlorella sorokiniana]